MPDAVSQIQARRVASDVYVTLVVPAQNIDGLQPADIARVDVLAVTTEGPPPSQPFELIAERIASVTVIRKPEEDTAQPSKSTIVTAPAGPEPGASMTIRETLGPEQLIPRKVATASTILGAERPPPPTSPEGDAKADAAAGRGASGVDSPPPGPRRYYMAIAVSDQGRSVSRGGLASVPVGPVLEAPAGLRISHTESAILISWSEVAGASGYNVYRDDSVADPGSRIPDPEPRVPTSAAPQLRPDKLSPEPWNVPVPAPLNAAALPATSFQEPVEFGRERCYRVRALAQPTGNMEGESSRICVTPDDHFPPAAPTELAALTAKEGITLRWAANTEPDLGGYLVLRGRSGDAKLLQIAAVPPTQTQYLDRDVMSGVRYVYAVVAVDSRKPEPNQSAESARDEMVAP